MAYARSLSDGHIKFTICTTAPANPAVPTAAELNAGIDCSALVLASDFSFGATDSDKVQEKSLVDVNNVNALGPSNLQAGFSLFRQFNTSTGAPDGTGDAAFTACKAKGTILYGYVRETGKLASAAWASADEARGMQLLTDEPQEASTQGGYVKKRIPCEPQTYYGLLAVG